MPPKPPKELEPFGKENTWRLYELACSLKTRANELIALMDRDRSRVRAAAIETILIEISGMMEGERFQRVIDSLHYDATRGQCTEITLASLECVRRIERLVVEAETGILKAEGAPYRAGAHVPPQERKLGQTQTLEHKGIDSNLILGALVLVGVIGVVAFTCIALSNRSDSR